MESLVRLILRVELKFKVIFGLIVLVASATIYYFKFWIPQRKGIAKFYSTYYNGVIMKIEKRNGYRVARHVLIDSTWQLLNWESEIIPSIQVGDSIVKEENSYLITVYRRGEDGQYQEVDLSKR